MDYSMNNNSKVITWCIYIHTNKLNGKVYIGKTCKNPKYRWNDGKGYKSQPYFWNAIQKYGWDGFHHEIFVEGLDEAEANELEIQLIKTYNSMNPEKGYNQTAGGEGMLGWHHSAESIQKIILSNQTRGVTEETKMKQREAHKGRYIKEKNPFWGKTHTEETKIKISVAYSQKKKNLFPFLIDISLIFFIIIAEQGSADETEQSRFSVYSSIHKIAGGTSCAYLGF